MDCAEFRQNCIYCLNVMSDCSFQGSSWEIENGWLDREVFISEKKNAHFWTTSQMAWVGWFAFLLACLFV